MSAFYMHACKIVSMCMHQRKTLTHASRARGFVFKGRLITKSLNQNKSLMKAIFQLINSISSKQSLKE